MKANVNKITTEGAYVTFKAGFTGETELLLRVNVDTETNEIKINDDGKILAVSDSGNEFAYLTEEEVSKIPEDQILADDNGRIYIVLHPDYFPSKKSLKPAKLSFGGK